MAYGAGKYWRNRFQGGGMPPHRMRPFGLGRMAGAKRQGWWAMPPPRGPFQRARRVAALRRMLRLTETRLGWANAAGRLLSDFREQIAAALAQEGGENGPSPGGGDFASAVAEPYDAAVDSIDTSGAPPVENTPETTGGAHYSDEREVTTRALHKVFEEWEAKGGKPTSDGHPRVDDINAELRQEGYAESSRDVIRAAYEDWAAKGGGDDELEKPTQGEVFEAFAELLGRDMTTEHAPYVKDVNRALRKEGYRPIKQKEVHELFEKFKREVRKRPRGRK